VVSAVPFPAEPAPPLPEDDPDPQAVAAKNKIPRPALTKFFIILNLTGFNRNYFTVPARVAT
jgi:hypothetical protein